MYEYFILKQLTNAQMTNGITLPYAIIFNDGKFTSEVFCNEFSWGERSLRTRFHA